MLSLVKKDFLIVKRLFFSTVIIVAALLMFFAMSKPSFPSMLTLFYVVILKMLMLVQAISAEEEKYPKATALICSTPYLRKTYVRARYITFLTLFIICYVIDMLVKMFFHPAGPLTFNEVLLVLSVALLIFGIYMPIEIKLGLQKTKHVLMSFVIASAMGPSILRRLFPDIHFSISSFSVSPFKLSGVLIFINIVIFASSLFLSAKIFSKKEL